MSPHVTQRILVCTALSALLLTGVAFAIWGTAGAVGALCAGLVASANWAATLFLSKRLIAGLFTLGIGSLVLGVLGGWAMTPPARAVAEEG